MPYVVTWLAYYLGEIGVSSAVATSIATVIVNVTISVVVSKVTLALAGKPSQTGDPPQRMSTTRGTTAYRQLVYGQIRTGGFLVYMGTSGAGSKFLLAYLDAK